MKVPFLCLLWLAIPIVGSAQASADDCPHQTDAALEGSLPAAIQVRSEIRNLKVALATQDFKDASRAGVELLAQPEFSEGKTLSDVIGLLGRPDLTFASTADNRVEVFYNTNGGPLDVSFHQCRLFSKGMEDHPPHWGGTDAELAALWSKVRYAHDWRSWQAAMGV